MISLINKISNIIKRATISLTNNDDKSISYSQISYLGKTANMENIYPYGFSANAPVGNMALIFSVSGNEANLAGMPYSQQDRNKGLKIGEVVIGSPKTGSYIKFLENGDIEINSKGKVKINSISDINITSETFNLISNSAMNFTSGSFSFGFDTSGIFQGNGKFNFGTGGTAIARVGDSVLVDGKTGSITTGSTNNTSN